MAVFGGDAGGIGKGTNKPGAQRHPTKGPAPAPKRQPAPAPKRQPALRGRGPMPINSQTRPGFDMGNMRDMDPRLNTLEGRPGFNMDPQRQQQMQSMMQAMQRMQQGGGNDPGFSRRPMPQQQPQYGGGAMQRPMPQQQPQYQNYPMQWQPQQAIQDRFNQFAANRQRYF